MIKLGYTTGAIRTKLSLNQRIKLIWEIEKDAIELSFTRIERLNEKISNQSLRLIKQFKYISIHAPVKKPLNLNTLEGEKIRYPSVQGKQAIKHIINISRKVNAQTVIFHPDLVDNFKWLSDIFKNQLAFENMDVKTSFGRTIKDLNQVFIQAPKAKWVFDVNHLYTVNPTMTLTDDFLNAFKGRLCQYHLSGYNGFHDCLCLTKEDIILKGIKDFSIPILCEGGATRKGKKLLQKENTYILKRLKKQITLMN